MGLFCLRKELSGRITQVVDPETEYSEGIQQITCLGTLIGALTQPSCDGQLVLRIFFRENLFTRRVDHESVYSSLISFEDLSYKSLL